MQIVKEAWNLYEQEKYRSALEKINELLSSIQGFDIDNPNGTLLDENSLEALYLKGLIFFEHAEDECVEFLQQIPPTHNRYGEAMFLIALHNFQEWSDKVNAIKYFDLVPPTSSKYWSAKISKGFILSNEKKYKEALETLNEIPSDNELYGDALFSMADIYQQSGNLEKSEECYDKMPPNDKAYGKMIITRSMKLEKEGKIDECLATLAKMPIDDNYYLRSLDNRSNILRENNRVEEAIEMWENMPEHSQYYNSARIIGLANVYQLNKQYNEALEVLNIMEPLSCEEYITVLDMFAHIHKIQGNDDLDLKYKKWKQILEIRWQAAGIVDSYIRSVETTSEEELEFWQSISESNTEYYCAVLEQVILYAYKIKDNAKAKELYMQIPKEEKDRLRKKYKYNLELIEEKFQER